MASKIFIFIMALGLCCILFGLSVTRSIVREIEPNLPDIHHLTEPMITGPTIFYDANNNIKATFSSHNSDFTPIDRIPDLVKNAFISAEDKNFYTHDGIDYYALSRALINNLKGNHLAGASTITQQVIKNMVTGNDRSLSRKIVEALLARRLENLLTKDQILELYLNTIWLGEGAYGVSSASQVWFHKPLNELNPAEVAFLGALPKGPAIIDPKKHAQRAYARRHYVLERMCDNHMLDCKTISQWDSYPLPNPTNIDTSGVANDWYEESVRRHILNTYGVSLLYSGSMHVIEWKDSSLQDLAQNALDNGLNSYMKRHPHETEYPDGSVIIMDSRNGHVLSEIGGKTYNAGFDRSTQSKRQIGSIAKTIIAVSALQDGYEPDTDIMDVPIHIDDGYGNIWSPGADGGDGMGVISLTKALADSRNQAFVRIGYDMGFDNIYNTFYAYGLYDSNVKLLPSSMLGAVETTPMNVAIAYSRAINGGYNVDAQFIQQIKDKAGNILELSPTQIDKIDTNQIDVSDKIKTMLHSVVANGTAYEAFKGLNLENIGGKTGTSNEVIDSWFAGYKGPYVIVVHVGYDTPKSLGNHEFGATIAGPIAEEIMKGMTSF